MRNYNPNWRGLPTTETIAVDGTAYEIDCAYNTRGQLATLMYVFQGLDSSYGPWLWTPEGGLQPGGIEREAENATDLWCRNSGACL